MKALLSMDKRTRKMYCRTQEFVTGCDGKVGVGRGLWLRVNSGRGKGTVK